jgi:hypothetical protein
LKRLYLGVDISLFGRFCEIAVQQQLQGKTALTPQQFQLLQQQQQQQTLINRQKQQQVLQQQQQQIRNMQKLNLVSYMF